MEKKLRTMEIFGMKYDVIIQENNLEEKYSKFERNIFIKPSLITKMKLKVLENLSKDLC